MSHHITLFLIHNPKLAGIVGILIATVFAILGVSSLIENSRLPQVPSSATTTEVAIALKTQDRYWATIVDPPWVCSTLVKTPVGDAINTEVFLYDPADFFAILVTYTTPMTCSNLKTAAATGVAYPMSSRHAQLLRDAGRLASFKNDVTLAELCTTCGKQSSMWLAVISAIMVVLGLAIYPLAMWFKQNTTY